MSQKPKLAKGTRDFNAIEVAKRQYIISTIKKQFELFGFQPIETPSFETSETLMGKYGEEGDRLIFKILNSGHYTKKISDDIYASRSEKLITPIISEKALRYDLTVPFARYVVQHQNEISFPFKRYQIQPVWRADRPQKGRYREFYQCDADVIGSNSLWQEVEFVLLYDAVFTALKLEGVTIKINNRKILSGIAEVIGEEDKLIDFTVALDKLDKIGIDGVKNEMRSKGISENAINKINPLLSLKGDFETQVDTLSSILRTSEVGKQGINELMFINQFIAESPLETAQLQLDVTLARGLNYYTGAIIEVKAPNQVEMGSIGGGGRYDDLTGIFGLRNMSGVGISFGLDRIYLVLEELGLFPETISQNTQVLFINFGENEARHCVKTIQNLRQQGIKAELYPDAIKMGKQMGYADKRDIPYVVLLGDKEIENQTLTLKNMKTRDQKEFNFSELVSYLNAH